MTKVSRRPGGVEGSAPLLTRSVQQRLMRYYGLDDIPDVEAFLAPCDGGERERVLVREHADGVDVRVELPAPLLRCGNDSTPDLDQLCQLVEGVSHFMLIADRARVGLPTTKLELELQAEVDKFVILAVMTTAPRSRPELALLRRRLFEWAQFADPRGTVSGERYRLASRIAAQFTRRLERDYLQRSRMYELQSTLRRFFRAGQTTKLELARAA